MHAPPEACIAIGQFLKSGPSRTCYVVILHACKREAMFQGLQQLESPVCNPALLHFPMINSRRAGLADEGSRHVYNTAVRDNHELQHLSLQCGPRSGMHAAGCMPACRARVAVVACATAQPSRSSSGSSRDGAWFLNTWTGRHCNCGGLNAWYRTCFN